jgi:ELWxxDGT repeat protein
LISGWANVAGILLFGASDGPLGVELWRSGGQESNTYLLDDIARGPGSSVPRFFQATRRDVFFVANDNLTGDELWMIPSFAAHLPQQFVQGGRSLRGRLGLRFKRHDLRGYPVRQSCEDAEIESLILETTLHQVND